MWKSRTLFVFALVCSILLIRLYDDQNLGFITLYALLLLLVLSLAAVLTAPFFLGIEEESGRMDLYKDDTLSYRSTIVNRGIFFYPRIVCDYYSAGVIDYGPASVAVGPRQKRRSESEVVFPYRGVFQLGIKTLSVTDFLGLFRITFGVENPLIVTVFPRSSETFSIYLRRDAQGAAFRYDLYSENYADVANVRKYTPSDSFRKIHWKLSAKRGELMVKNYQSLEPNDTLLFIDAKRIPLPEPDAAAFEDKMISFVASAVNHCAQSRLSAWLVHGAGEGERVAIDPAEELEKIYRALAQIAYDRVASDFPVFCRTLEKTAAAYNILLFLSDIDETVVDAVNSFASHDDSVHVYYFYTEALPLTETINHHLDSLTTLGIRVNRVEV